ncbi:MAG: hypothetical protein FWC16_14760 [Defluviitaleaceae bacterium]|nr:hypothetical protein [Defluviitaleaceae bacterium]
MQDAILFNSVIEDNIIRVPEAYINFFKRGTAVAVEVINTPPRQAEAEKKFTRDHFTALKIDTRGWEFDREEANARR